MTFQWLRLLLLILFMLSAAISYAGQDQRRRYVNIKTTTKTKVIHVVTPAPKVKKYIYDMNTQKLIGYTYKKLLPTQVALFKRQRAPVKDNSGFRIQLKRAVATNSQPVVKRSLSNFYAKERPSSDLKDNEVIRVETIVKK